MNTVEALKIVNAALTRTGNNTITSFTDGSDEALVANSNYEEIILEELSDYPYSFSKEDAPLTIIVQPAFDEWDYVYQLPATLIRLIRIHISGKPIEFKKKADKVFCNEPTGVRAEYIYRADELDWSYDFRGKITARMEALFLRALSESYEAAEAREKFAQGKGIYVRNSDSQNQTPKDRRQNSRLIDIRRG
jgi:hypothetical protein